MKKHLIFGLLFIFGINNLIAQNSELGKSRSAVNKLLNRWHKAAAEADYETYFQLMAPESIFIGTDATENWNKKEFMQWSKPYFQKGTAWDFKKLERNIFFSENGKIAWFDEILDTHMGLARGSGVLIKEGGKWKVKQYVLSLTFPNTKLSEVKNLKDSVEKDLFPE